MSDFTGERLENKVKDVINEILVKGEVKNSIAPLCSVTKVSLTADNKSAKVFISVLPEDRGKTSVDALNRAHSFIQGKIASVLKTKNTPVITFSLDNSIKEGDRINMLIDKEIKD